MNYQENTSNTRYMPNTRIIKKDSVANIAAITSVAFKQKVQPLVYVPQLECPN